MELLQDLIKKELEKVCANVCDNLCKYRESADDDLVCDYRREHGTCPLDKLA